MFTFNIKRVVYFRYVINGSKTGRRGWFPMKRLSASTGRAMVEFEDGRAAWYGALPMLRYPGGTFVRWVLV